MQGPTTNEVINLFIHGIVTNNQREISRAIDGASFNIEPILEEAFEIVQEWFNQIVRGHGVIDEDSRRIIAESMLHEARNGVRDRFVLFDRSRSALDQAHGSPPGRTMLVPQMRAPPAPGRNVRRRLYEPEPLVVPETFSGSIIQRRNLSLRDDCPVCHLKLSQNQDEEATNNEEICMLYECGHVFHCECINGVIRFNEQRRTRTTCPVCRTRIQSVVPVQLPRGSSFGSVNTSLSAVSRDIRYLNRLKK
jgi:hypothetical protein